MIVTNSIITQKIIRDCAVALVVWGLILLLLNAEGLPDDYRILWVLIVSVGIPLYAYSLGILLPKVSESGKGFLHYLLKFIVVVSIFIGMFTGLYVLIYKAAMSDTSILIELIVINYIFHLALTAPVSWFMYNYHLAKQQELLSLKTELGQSLSNIDFLRSQINPHFLFNVLNTLYSSALQEGSEHTAQGIQRLGDMMRFMLHENQQEKISLAKDIEYIANYISLQQLRTRKFPDFLVETNIEAQSDGYKIAPMLLIPFIENAFKHGVSISRPSWIKISLHASGNTLYFDVCNSIHPKSESDPERDRAGIGLENVTDRLALIYPDNHELIVRNTPQEFFVHLTINL